MSTVTQRYTAEDLLKMPDGDMYELVNGELVEKRMSFKSDHIGFYVAFNLELYCRSQKRGRALAETSYRCFPDDSTRVRRPDASYISFERLPADQPDPDGHCQIVPDVVAEVISPNDIIDELSEKIEDYKAAGVRLIWVFDPRSRSVQVYRADGTGEIIPSKGELTGEDVLPGFRVPVVDFFPSPVAKA